MEEKKVQQGANMAEEDAPGDFLAKLSKVLREKSDIDVGLVDILTKHLLTSAPNTDAVARAKEAILELASERGNVPK
jgi:hypothetical protein